MYMYMYLDHLLKDNVHVWPGVMFLITILCSYDNCVRVLILLLQLGLFLKHFPTAKP